MPVNALIGVSGRICSACPELDHFEDLLIVDITLCEAPCDYRMVVLDRPRALAVDSMFEGVVYQRHQPKAGAIGRIDRLALDVGQDLRNVGDHYALGCPGRGLPQAAPACHSGSLTIWASSGVSGLMYASEAGTGQTVATRFHDALPVASDDKVSELGAAYDACANMSVMAKQKTTLYLDQDVLRQTEAAAAGSGRDESAVVEDALRRYLSLEVVDRVWARNAENALGPDEALALAYEELRAARAERDAPAA